MSLCVERLEEIFMETVSSVAMIGMCFSMVIAIGFPIALMVYAFRKLKADMVWFAIGAVTFIVFSLVLEQIMHTIVIKHFSILTSNFWLWAIYGALAAGIFEEVGRFTAMHLFKKKDLNKNNAFMYGVGHGGIESIVIVGLTNISNLITSFMINSGTFEQTLGSLDGSLKEQTMRKVSLLWTTEPLAFYLGGVERISAVTIHICLSYLVYRAVKESKIRFLFLSIAIHTLVDTISGVVGATCSAVMLEVVLAAVAVVIAVCVYKNSKKITEDIN